MKAGNKEDRDLCFRDAEMQGAWACCCRRGFLLVLIAFLQQVGTADWESAAEQVGALLCCFGCLSHLVLVHMIR